MWWGLDAHIRDVTERFTREGYVALAPDLYHGKVAAEPDEARKAAEAFRAALVKHGKTHDIHVYPAAPHAFFNDTRPSVYRPDAAQDAWRKTLKWFETYLR